jgi:hypothetical protein
MFGRYSPATTEGTQPMNRTSHAKPAVAFALACSATLVLAVTTAQARPAGTVASRAVAAHTISRCSIVVSGTPWRIRAGGSISGDTYTISAHGLPCSTARPWVLNFTKQSNPGIGKALKGPDGFTCRSWTTPASGAKLVVSGVCAAQPHNNPFFGWGPKVK